MNFNTGDAVKYGAYGECTIKDRREENICGRRREFFILSQVANPASTIYVPVEKADTLKEVKRALTADEIKGLRDCGITPIDWSEDDKKRDAKFKQAYERANIAEIAGIYKNIYLKQAELKAARKKLRATDLNAMKICERILFDEFSRTLSIAQEDVATIIMGGADGSGSSDGAK